MERPYLPSFDRLKETYAKIKPHLPNKYWIALLLFLVIMTFFDKSSLIKRIRYDREINELRKEIRYYEAQRDEALKGIEDLRIGTQEIEKIAREQYHMKRENEDVFLLETK